MELIHIFIDCGIVVTLNTAQSAGYKVDYEQVKKAFQDCDGHPDIRSNRG